MLSAGAVSAAMCCLVVTTGLLSSRGREQQVVLTDALDSAVDSLAMLNAGGFSNPGASPGRWHHLNAQNLDNQRVLSRVTNANNVARFSNMPPDGQFSYSPTDHLLARGSSWLANDGEADPLLEEANRVLGHYERDVHAKGGVDWNSIGGQAFKPAPYMAGTYSIGTPGMAEGHEGMRGTLDAVNSNVYGQPVIPIFEAGDRSYLQHNFRPSQNVHAKAQMFDNRMTKENAAATYNQIAGLGLPADDYTIGRYSRQMPWVTGHLDNANKHLATAQSRVGQPSEDAMRAYITAVNGAQGQKSTATSYIISEYMKRLQDAARRRVSSNTPKTAFGPGPVPDKEPQKQGYSKITFNRTDRTASATGGARDTSGDAAVDDVREARIRRAAEEAAAAEAEEVAEQVKRAMKPLDSRIATVEAQIASAAASAAVLPVAAPAGTRVHGLSLSVPGPITIDHLQLPGGEYSLQLGADTAIFPPDATAPSVSPQAAAPVAAPTPPTVVPAAEDADEEGFPEGVLDKKKDLHVKLDRAAVKQAAMDLQKKVIDEFEAAGGDVEGSSGGSGGSASTAAATEDDVLDTAKATHRGLDRAAMRVAAVALQKKTLERAHTGAGADTRDDDVLDTSKQAAAHVDQVAMRNAAEKLQNDIISHSGAAAQSDATTAADEDDVLDTVSGTDNGVDRSAVMAAAEGVLQSTLGGSHEKPSDLPGDLPADLPAEGGDDDVLDTVAGTDTGVDRAAVKAAAEGILQSTLTGASGKRDTVVADDDVLDSAVRMDTGVDVSGVKAAADGVMRSKLGETDDTSADVLDSAAVDDRGVDSAAVAQAAAAIEHQIVSDGGSMTARTIASTEARTSASMLGTASDAASAWGKNKGVLATQIQHKLQHKLEQQAKHVRGKVPSSSTRPAAAGLKSRFQMLSDTMLMPMNVLHDPSDTYLDPVGGTQHRRELATMYGSFERSDKDKQKMLQIRDLEDKNVEQGDILRPHDFSGGVGTKAHLHQVGGQIGAWYSSWWEHPNVQDLEEQTQEMLGLTSDVSGEPTGTDDGKRKLIMEGLNVNGWEPGRDTQQIRQDHLEHTQVSMGFWNDDGSAAQTPDVGMHHPCGSPLRTRPCDDDIQHTTPPASGGQSPVTARANRAGGSSRIPVNFDPSTRAAVDPLWVDPMPLDVLCKGRVNASWCPGEDDAGDEGDDEDDEGAGR